MGTITRILAHNITGSDAVLTDLPVANNTIPAGATVLLADPDDSAAPATIDQVQSSDQLRALVTNDTILINDGSGDLSKADSLAVLVSVAQSAAITSAATRVATNNTQTGSTSFQHAFTGQGLDVPHDGDYWAIFEGNCETGGGNPNGMAIGIGVNDQTEQADSEREIELGVTEPQSVTTTAYLPGLVVGDDVRGLFRKTGGGGNVRMTNRRLTIMLVE